MADEDGDAKLAELEAELAAAKVERLEKELALQRAKSKAEVEDASSSSSSQGPPPVHSEEKPLQKLVDMGFSRRKSLAALQSHGGSAEDAIAELLSSPQEQTPLQKLEAMGFARAAAAAALRRQGHLDRALEELLGNAQDIGQAGLREPNDQEILEEIQEDKKEDNKEHHAAEAEADKLVKEEEKRNAAVEAESETNVKALSQEDKKEDGVAEAEAGNLAKHKQSKQKQKEPAEPETKRRRITRKGSMKAEEIPEASAPSAAAKAKGKAKGKAQAKAKAKASGSMVDALAAVWEDTEMQLLKRPQIEAKASISLAQVTLPKDRKVQEEAKSEAVLDGQEAARAWKSRKRHRFGQILDAISWLLIVLRAGNNAFFQSLSKSKLRLPAMLLAILKGQHPDWASKESVKKALNALQEAQNLWRDDRLVPELGKYGNIFKKDFQLWLSDPKAVRNGGFGYCGRPLSQILETRWSDLGAEQTEELLVRLAEAYPMLKDHSSTNSVEIPNSVSFDKGASALVKANVLAGPWGFVSDSEDMEWDGVYDPYLLARRRLNRPPRAKMKSADLKGMLCGLLQTVNELTQGWPGIFEDLQMFLRLKDIRLARPSEKSYTFGEKFHTTEFKALTGCRPDSLMLHVQERPWRAIEQSDLKSKDTSADGLLLPQDPGQKGAIRDPEDQLQALMNLGVVDRRSLLTPQEKLEVIGDFRMRVKQTSIVRCHWFCEGCNQWLDTREARGRNPLRSAPRDHRCGQLDRTRGVQDASTAKPKVFEIVKGADLGLQMNISLTRQHKLDLQCPIASILKVAEYAAGFPCDRLKAFVRVTNALKDDGEANAEQEIDKDDGPNEAEEEPDEEADAVGGGATSSRPSKRRRQAEVLPEMKDVTGAVRFSLLSCAAIAEVPATPPRFLLPLHHNQRRTVFWMASREGVAISGAAQNDTAFHGFVSVQRLSRQMGKSDVSVQLKVERLFADAKGGLLADAVGYGKTASVLALIALTPSPPMPFPSIHQKLLRSRATLVMLPPNLFDQWQGEIKKFLSPEIKTVAIASLSTLKQCTVRQLRTADIVLVSLRLLSSVKYQEHLDAAAGLEGPTDVVIPASKVYEEARKKWCQKKQYIEALHRMWGNLENNPRFREVGVPSLGPEPKLKDFSDKKTKKSPEVTSERLIRRRWRLRQRTEALLRQEPSNIDDLTMPPLEMFYWRRLVVDELHEPLRALRDVAGLRDKKLTADTRILFHNFEALEAESRWGLTATPPLSSAAEVSFLARFHRVFVPRDSDLEAQHYLDEYVRSDDLDVSSIPIEYHLIAVRHTGGERALYLNAASVDEPHRAALLQICNFFSPDDRDDDMASAINTTRSDNELELAKHRTEMEETQEKIKRFEREEALGWPDAKNEDEAKKRKEKLRRLQHSVPVQKQKERRLESRNRYFEEVLKELKKLEQDSVDCPICMTSMEPEDCSVTGCGHLFCRDCITSWVSEKGKCPTCNHALRWPGGVAAAREVLSRNQEAAAQGRISRFGSKLEAVCSQLQQIWRQEDSAKVIIFVQFEVLLGKMKGALSSMGMSCLTLHGSVFERRRVIRQFHAEGRENRILLLSLERSPAGMNLVCCHHLILVHPMLAESKEAALSFERQAIGRVRRQGQKEQVHVYRFFVRDTMEEEMVRSHHRQLLDQKEPEEATGEPDASMR